MTSFKLALIASATALAAACSSPEEEMSGAHADTAQMPHNDADHGAMDDSAMDRGAVDADAMNHGDMNPGAMAAAEATAPGVLNAIDVENGAVNLTHPPMPEIGWPEMAMDLPVTRAVDLSQFSAGDRVTFTVRRGRDDQFRIVAMDVVADE